MAGNSWLAIAQINFASRYNHSALKALAPWEALTNLYDDIVGRGGIPNTRFLEMIANGLAGKYANIPSLVQHDLIVVRQGWHRRYSKHVQRAAFVRRVLGNQGHSHREH